MAVVGLHLPFALFTQLIMTKHGQYMAFTQGACLEVFKKRIRVCLYLLFKGKLGVIKNITVKFFVSQEGAWPASFHVSVLNLFIITLW